MAVLVDAIYNICAAQNPVTVRQVFYRLVAAGLVDKTETEYRATAARLMINMRRSGVLPYSWVADNTRWMRKPRTYNGIEDMMNNVDRAYRSNLWTRSDAEVEIWLEKDALASVLGDVTDEYGVALMVTRGQPSLTFTYEAAQHLGYKSRTHLYYFGDLDESGLSIESTIQSHLDEHGLDYQFERVAVTEQQVNEWNLPTRPDKDGRSWAIEVDAIEPNVLRRLCREVIEPHLDMDEVGRLRRIEDIERNLVTTFTNAWTNIGDEDLDALDEIATEEGTFGVLNYLTGGN
jgi:hypothetical protein